MAYGIAFYDITVPQLREFVEEALNTNMSTADTNTLLEKVLQVENRQFPQKIKEYYDNWSNGRYEEFLINGQICFSDLRMLHTLFKRDLPKEKHQKLLQLMKYGLYQLHYIRIISVRQTAV